MSKGAGLPMQSILVRDTPRPERDRAVTERLTVSAAAGELPTESPD